MYKMTESSPSLILLTYKGKVLLMHKQSGVMDAEAHPWCLIESVRSNKETFEDALFRTVQKETGIKLENIKYISKFRYHAALTDDNINKMQRAENQLLDFFTLKDLEKLLLSSSTREFVSDYGYLTQATSD